MVPSGSRPRIVSRLRELGMTQRAIAATVGVSQRTVSNDLSNIAKPKPDKRLSDLPPDQRAHAEAPLAHPGLHRMRSERLPPLPWVIPSLTLFERPLRRFCRPVNLTSII